MPIEVEILNSIEQMDEAEYRVFHHASGASFFYDWRFLCAAERSPLLAIKGAFYLLARENGRLVGFVPAYLQLVQTVDPFGLLARTADIQSDREQCALFSHAMHCFDSGVIVLLGASAEDALAAALKALAIRLDAQYVGLLNVASDQARQQLAGQGLAVRYLVDRYFMDMTRFEDFGAVLKALPKDGRYEMTRQLRKFAAGSGGISLLSPPFDHRLEQLTELCQQTTARNGTPQYFPAQTLARFVRTCEGLIRLVVVEDQGVVVGGLICFLDGTLMCIWSAGMRYDLTDYSPYTVSFAYAYEWALGAGIDTIEAGRLNARIKTRLGLQPLPLYSATSVVAV